MTELDRALIMLKAVTETRDVLFEVIESYKQTVRELHGLIDAAIDQSRESNDVSNRTIACNNLVMEREDQLFEAMLSIAYDLKGSRKMKRAARDVLGRVYHEK